MFRVMFWFACHLIHNFVEWRVFRMLMFIGRAITRNSKMIRHCKVLVRQINSFSEAGHCYLQKNCVIFSLILSFSVYFGEAIASFASMTSRWFQVMGIPRKGGQCLAVIHSNIVALNTRLLTRYVRRHPSKSLTPKRYLKSFSDASESHKTSTNLFVRVNFRQFSDW